MEQSGHCSQSDLHLRTAVACRCISTYLHYSFLFSTKFKTKKTSSNTDGFCCIVFGLTQNHNHFNKLDLHQWLSRYFLGGIPGAGHAGCIGFGSSGLCQAAYWKWSQYAPLSHAFQAGGALQHGNHMQHQHTATALVSKEIENVQYRRPSHLGKKWWHYFMSVLFFFSSVV